MQTRCAYPDCFHIFDTSDENDFKAIDCPSCKRKITVRSLARHLEIDRQIYKQQANNKLAEQYFQSGLQAGSFVSVLEEIRSLWNVGSIFRSADGSGFDHLFLIGITGCPPRKEIEKTSLGAEDHIDWHYSGNSLTVIHFLKQLGYQIVALEKCKRSLPLKEAIKRDLIQSPVCLIVGSEVKGIYAETLDAADLIVDLPMRGFKESLNVAVAFGIAAYAITESLFQN